MSLSCCIRGVGLRARVGQLKAMYMWHMDVLATQATESICDELQYVSKGRGPTESHIEQQRDRERGYSGGWTGDRRREFLPRPPTTRGKLHVRSGGQSILLTAKNAAARGNDDTGSGPVWRTAAERWRHPSYVIAEQWRHAGTVTSTTDRHARRKSVLSSLSSSSSRRCRCCTADVCVFTVGLVDIGHQIGTSHRPRSTPIRRRLHYRWPRRYVGRV